MVQPQPLPEPPPAEPKAPGMSLAARLLNIFAMPGAVFAEVSSTRRSVSNWLVPMVLAGLVGVASALMIYSQPAVRETLRAQHDKLVEKQVAAHKMSQADADLVRRWLAMFTTRDCMMAFGGAGAVVGAVVRVCWWALVLWWLGRMFLKVRFGYGKALELAGLGTMINVLGMLVLVLLMVKLHRGVVTPGFTFSLTDLDSLRKDPLVLGTASVFSFWSVVVMSMALARLSAAPFLRAAWLVFAYWLLQESVCGLFGLAQFGF